MITLPVGSLSGIIHVVARRPWLAGIGVLILAGAMKVQSANASFTPVKYLPTVQTVQEVLAHLWYGE